MIRALALICPALALAACSPEPSSDQESADSFADRIGGNSEGSPALDPSVRAEQPNTVQADIANSTDVTALEQLGDVGGVEFGPRSGGCTFMDGNREIFMAAAMAEPTMPSKAVIRVGGTLAMLEGQAGNLQTVRTGSTYRGDGVTVQVGPAQGNEATRPANLAVTSANGKTVTYSGNWNCS